MAQEEEEAAVEAEIELEIKEGNHTIITCCIQNCVTCAENFIVNLSAYELSVLEKFLLSKGLSFIPTAKDLINFEILSGFDRFVHKLYSLITPTIPYTNYTLHQCGQLQSFIKKMNTHPIQYPDQPNTSTLKEPLKPLRYN